MLDARSLTELLCGQLLVQQHNSGEQVQAEERRLITGARGGSGGLQGPLKGHRVCLDCLGQSLNNYREQRRDAEQAQRHRKVQKQQKTGGKNKILA